MVNPKSSTSHKASQLQVHSWLQAARYGDLVTLKQMRERAIASDAMLERLQQIPVLGKLVHTFISPQSAAYSLMHSSDRKNVNALLRAAEGGHEAVVEWLIHEVGIDSTYTDNEGHNAMHYAVLGQSLEVCNYLKQLNPELVSLTNCRGQQPLHLAAAKGYREIMTVFESEQDPFCFSGYGNTPAHIAARNGQDEILREKIQQHPSLLYAVNFKGDTILHILCKKGNREMIQELLQMDIELLEFENQAEQTGLELLLLNGHKNLFWEFYEQQTKYNISTH